LHKNGSTREAGTDTEKSRSFPQGKWLPRPQPVPYSNYNTGQEKIATMATFKQEVGPGRIEGDSLSSHKHRVPTNTEKLLY
jgi:hypothetical protein